ncbi:MAG TPA: dihydrolipoamide acetyltransferase family protein [Candidatus Methylomirabilis sp.]|nr:dihydrolipoamide acetyltransferase family protein [Candidatus Methylomirabilis sp.]
MATRLDMPQLGLTMEKGTILQWLTAEGAMVQKGQPVVLIQTEKVEYEVEAPATGTLLKLVAKEGTELPVGGLMGILGQPGEDVSKFLAGTPVAVKPRADTAEPRAAPSPAGRVPGESRAAEPVAGPQISRASGERIKISPVAKKLAQEHGIDISALIATGPEGRIVREDVERAIATRGAPSAGYPLGVQAPSEPTTVPEMIPLSGIRKVIFDRMGQSWREAARVTLFADADMTELVKLRRARLADWERQFGIKPSYSDLIHMAVAKALRVEPRINCRLDGQAVRICKEVNLAFAVDLGEGLIAAVIRDADKKSLGDLAKAARELADRARSGRLTPADMADGTFTVTNLGTVGVESFTPIINPPQAGILGVGKIMEKPVVLNGGIHIRSMMTLSLVFDHRLIDGAPAARFLAKVKELLDQPAWIG